MEYVLALAIASCTLGHPCRTADAVPLSPAAIRLGQRLERPAARRLELGPQDGPKDATHGPR